MAYMITSNNPSAMHFFDDDVIEKVHLNKESRHLRFTKTDGTYWETSRMLGNPEKKTDGSYRVRTRNSVYTIRQFDLKDAVKAYFSGRIKGV